MMPQFFHHHMHQIDLAQRALYGLKINLPQIALILIVDYAENYTHLAQVCTMHQCTCSYLVDESDALVPKTILSPDTHYSGSLLGL